MGQDNARKGSLLETTDALLHTLGVGCTCVFMEKVTGAVTVQCILISGCISNF